MANINDVILSSTYNAIRGTVNRVLGFGNGTDTGYGATLESTSKGGQNIIRAADMQALYNDLVKARTHQKGTTDLQWSNPDGLASPDSAELIGVFAADVGNIPNQPTFTYIDPVSETVSGSGTGARWSVIHIGEGYTVNIFINQQTGQLFTGQNYAPDDQILIRGTELGGLQPQHDLLITVVEVNSTGGITFFSTSGIGKAVQTSEYANDDLNQGIQDFIDAAQDIDNDKDLVGPGQASIETVAFSRRTTAWTKGIDHRVTVTWRDSEARRFFFNSGGEIRFFANLTNIAGSQKELNWQSMLSEGGTVKFGKYSTTATGTSPGTTSDFGNYSGTTQIDWTTTSKDNPLFIYQKDGSGVYSENQHYISVHQVTANSLEFAVVFLDNDVGDPPLNPPPPGALPTGVDESVSGYLDSTVQVKTATGILNISAPTVREINLL